MTPFALLQQFKKTLLSLDGWLTKATAYADAKKFDTSVLMQARLAPDMFPFARQVQSTCDNAKFVFARLTGKDAPSFSDDETTFAQLHERIAKTIAFLDSFKDGDFAGVSEKRVGSARWNGKTMSGPDYIVQYGIPNFYFHASTAYLILRHNGVEVGKLDFLGQLEMS
ncbi:MAG TPA: DUF1993 domain-containing protein [Kofleriaceae bacterium]|jgi:hypothetical protein